MIADQEFQCYLGILRNHEQHNYSQRASMAQSVQKASSALHKTVDSWNQVRRKLGLEALSIKAIREDGILQWSYDTSTTAQNKHNYWYYECISLQERSKEERIYLSFTELPLIWKQWLKLRRIDRYARAQYRGAPISTRDVNGMDLIMQHCVSESSQIHVIYWRKGMFGWNTEKICPHYSKRHIYTCFVHPNAPI